MIAITLENLELTPETKDKYVHLTSEGYINKKTTVILSEKSPFSPWVADNDLTFFGATSTNGWKELQTKIENLKN